MVIDKLKALYEHITGPLSLSLMMLPIFVLVFGPPIVVSWGMSSVLVSSIKYFKSECGQVYVIDKVLYSNIFCSEE